MTADLLVTDARLLDGRVVSLLVRNGRYAALVPAGEPLPTGPELPAGIPTLDAGGALVTESFVNGHMHLDKVHTLPRAGEAALTAYTAGTMGAAMSSIELASAVKRGYDRSWIAPNVRRALDAALTHGTLHVLAFVDVDTTTRFRADPADRLEPVTATEELDRDDEAFTDQKWTSYAHRIARQSSRPGDLHDLPPLGPAYTTEEETQPEG